MGRLAEMVEELEQEASELEDRNKYLEDEIEELESKLEDSINQCNKLQEFEDWVHDVYPEVYRDYHCLVDLKEKSNGIE